LKHFEENGLLGQWLGEVLMETPPGGMVNHISSRKEKTTSLQKIFKTSLPPLPYPCSELKNFEAIKSHFSKMMAVELQGLKFKWGDAPPNRIKEWLREEDEALFKLLKGQAYDRQLSILHKEKGYKTISSFYKSMIELCYVRRAGDGVLLHYHMQSDLEEARHYIANRAEIVPNIDGEINDEEEEDVDGDFSDEANFNVDLDYMQEDENQIPMQEQDQEHVQRQEEMRKRQEIENREKQEREREEMKRRRRQEEERVRREENWAKQERLRKEGEEKERKRRQEQGSKTRQEQEHETENLQRNREREARSQEKKRTSQSFEDRSRSRESSSERRNNAEAIKEWKERLCPGILLGFHKDAISQNDDAYLQINTMRKKEGKVE
jgi:hypothetical protein